MTKQEIIDQLRKKHDSFIKYLRGLTAEEFVLHYQDKWTAGQLLEHIVICVKPLVQVFGMDRSMIKEKFGQVDRPAHSYNDLITMYIQKLKEGAKAPDRFVPGTVLPDQRTVLCETLSTEVKELCFRVEGFTEKELDSLCIPHPLFGILTLREMLYNAIQHVAHHKGKIKEYLNLASIR